MCNCTNCRCDKQCKSNNTLLHQKPTMTPELYKYWYEGGTVEQLHATNNNWSKVSPDFLVISKGFIYRKARTPHIHADVIKAWADGLEIEYKYGDSWIPTTTPGWYGLSKYRVKPD